MASPRHSATVMSILQSTQALEDQVEKMKLELAKKDAEIEGLKTKSEEKAYSILSSSFAVLRGFYAKGCEAPVVGAIPRFYYNTADVVVKRATPFSGGCDQLGDKFTDMLKFIDHRVLSPQVHAYKASAIAVSQPVIRVTAPFTERVRPLANQVTTRVMSAQMALRQRLVSIPKTLRLRAKVDENNIKANKAKA